MKRTTASHALLVAAVAVALVPPLEVSVILSMVILGLAWALSSVSLFYKEEEIPRSLLLVHIGITAQVAGTIVRLVESALSGGEVAIPSWADLIVIPALLLMLVGAYQAARTRSAIAEAGDILDAVLTAALPVGGAVVISWEYLTGSAPMSERLMNSGFLAIDAVFLTLTFLLIYGAGTRSRGAVWLGVAGIFAVLFDLLLVVAHALDATWLNESLRLLSIGFVFYAIAVTDDSYVSFASPGFRPQRHRWHVYVFAMVILPLIVYQSESVVAGWVLAAFSVVVLLARLAVTARTATRLAGVVEIQADLARALSNSDTEGAALRSGMVACRKLAPGREVMVLRQDGVITVQPEAGWIPPYVRVAFDQVAQVLDFAIESIEARLDSKRVETETVAQLARVAARTDRVTGFKSRADFDDQDSLTNCAVINLYFHDVERVGESQGMEAAEELLRVFSQRVVRVFRGKDAVWSGDGPRLIVVSDGIEIEKWLDVRRDELSEPVSVGGRTFTPTVNVGVLVVGDQAESRAEALAKSEMALNFAWDINRNATGWYSEELRIKTRRSWEIGTGLERALQNPAENGFSVFYQPLVSTGLAERVVAAEALVRWTHPELGPVSPGEFISIAESHGLVDKIDVFVLETVIADLPRLRAGCSELVVHLNMSPVGDLAAKLERVGNEIAAAISDDAGAITIEITESGLGIQDEAALLQACRSLRTLGIGLAVDDFGTGESNFNRVAALPFSEVKLASTFAQSDDAVFVQSMVGAIHELQMKCVAENVETEQQREFVTAAGVDIIQGYFYAMPAPLPEFCQWLETRGSVQGIG